MKKVIAIFLVFVFIFLAGCGGESGSIGGTTATTTTTRNTNPTYKVFDGDYEYTYGGELKGYSVKYVGDKNTKFEANNIKESIEGWPVIAIENEAFSLCTCLTSIIIPNNVANIGANAFSGCTSLTSVTIPDSVTTIEYGAFSDCTSLTNVIIPNSVTSIGVKEISSGADIVFNGAFQNCTGLTSITIPNSVTVIGPKTFVGCTSLIGVTIPDSVSTIEYSAFSGCTNLTTIIIPNSVTAIGSFYEFSSGGGISGIPFYSCAALTNITYGGTVKQWTDLVTFWQDEWEWAFQQGLPKVQCLDGVVEW